MPANKAVLHHRHGRGVDMLLTNSVAVGGDQAETATGLCPRWPASTAAILPETCTSSWASRRPPRRRQGGISDRSLSAPWISLKLEGFHKRNRFHLYSLEWFGPILHSYDKLVYQFNTVYKFVYEFGHHTYVYVCVVILTLCGYYKSSDPSAAYSSTTVVASACELSTTQHASVSNNLA
jgi:hypothetical protein